MTVILVILGIAFILYGILIMAVASGTWFFAFWYLLGGLFLAAAWILHSGWWDALPSPIRHLCGIVAALLLIGFSATQIMIASHFDDHAEDGLDYLIVLGAQVRETGPSTVLQFRLDAARDYLENNPETRCIVSGGKGPNEPVAEADAMAEYLIEHGIDESRIIRENQSENTAQNIAFSKELIDSTADRIGIATNNFHLFRALGIARKSGLETTYGISADSLPLFLPNNLVRESLGIAKDFVVGNL